MPGVINPAIIVTTFSLTGVSPSSGTIFLTSDPPTSAFTDFAYVYGYQGPDPFFTHILNQSVILNSTGTSFVRVSLTATAPVGYAPGSAADVGRAAYAGMGTQEVLMPANGVSYLDHAQFETGASTTLLSSDAEGYDTGMLYSLEPGVGALWERSQAHTLVGLYAGHFIASPAYSGNSYQKVSNFSSYNQLLAANRTYADVLNGPS